MPNTPNLNLPYPPATDPVAGGAAAIQALATAVDGYAKNTALVVTPAGSGLTLTGSQLRRAGKVVSLTVQINFTGSVAAGTTLLTLNTAADRPATQVPVWARLVNNNTAQLMVLENTGALTMPAYAGANGLTVIGQMTYVVA